MIFDAGAYDCMYWQIFFFPFRIKLYKIYLYTHMPKYESQFNTIKKFIEKIDCGVLPSIEKSWGKKWPMFHLLK